MKFIGDIVCAGGLTGKEAEHYKAFWYCCLRCFAGERFSFFILADKCYEWVTQKNYESIDQKGFDGIKESDRYNDHVDEMIDYEETRIFYETTDAWDTDLYGTYTPAYIRRFITRELDVLPVDLNTKII